VPRGLSASALVSLVRAQCTGFGEVIDIKLMPPLSESRLIFVQMRTETQRHELSQALGQNSFGDVVAIQVRYAPETLNDWSKLESRNR
jgi:hypothetical protein